MIINMLNDYDVELLNQSTDTQGTPDTVDYSDYTEQV